MVAAALAAGYRHFDSAQLYNNEAELGRAVREGRQLGSDVIVGRGEVFLTTKIRYPGFSKAKTWGKVVDSVKKMSGVEVATGRKRKRVDDEEGPPSSPSSGQGKTESEKGEEYVDLFLVHTPYGGPNAKENRKEMWLALERAYEEGKARAIGVSNYKVEHLEEMREYAKVWPPHVNQIQVSRVHMHAQSTVHSSSRTNGDKRNMLTHHFNGGSLTRGANSGRSSPTAGNTASWSRRLARLPGATGGTSRSWLSWRTGMGSRRRRC